MTLREPGENTPGLPPDDTEILANEIALLSAHIQAATCRLLLLIAEMDRRGGHGDLGFISCAHWLSWRTGDSLSTAREKVRVARKLEDCPLVHEAFAEGRISYSKVRAITRIVTPENEQVLLEQALDGSTSQLERVVRAYRRAAPAEQELAQRQQAGRNLSYYHDDENMVVLRGRLPPEVGALLVKALQVAGEAQQDDSAEPAQQLCDALGEVAGAALSHGLAEQQGKAPRADYKVLVHVDGDVLANPEAPGRCEVQGAVGISPQTARRLCCDAPALEVHDAGEQPPCGEGRENAPETFQLKRRRRRAGAALRRAVRARDKGVCSFPGCQNRRYLHLHHVKHWAQGGSTDLGNLTLLCSHHHRAVHEGGYQVERGKQGGLRFSTPGGSLLSEQPPPLRLPGQPVPRLLNQQQDLPISAETGKPTWDGTVPVDYPVAVEALLDQAGFNSPPLQAEVEP